MVDKSPLLHFLKGESAVDRLDAESFSLLLAEARACGLLGRVAHAITTSPTAHLLASHLQDQLMAANIHSSGFRQDVWRELAYIEKALSGLNTPVILLKGASYVLLGLPAADGRIFSDVDILVTKEKMAHAEAALMLGGWSTGKLDDYDHRYYRQWSHEIPPMTHLRRGTTIDLHHSLVMPTCRIRVNSNRMVDAAVSEGGFWWRLQDSDMVLHAAVHFMLNPEFDRGLRDLWDIDMLYRYFTKQAADFPERLSARAKEVGLGEVIVQILGLTSSFFRTPLPFPSAPKSLFSHLAIRSASTRHPETRPFGQGMTDTALMLREMYLRLPNRLMVVHLWHKMSGLFSTQKKTKAG